MRIAVCVKQVPLLSSGTTDMASGTVIRSGRTRMNSYDAPALEAGLRLRELFGGSVDVFTMGPPGAREVLAEALATGADSAWLMTDPAFAGADSLATARTLVEGFARAGGFDVIICGQKTTDGGTGQVGAEIAALLGVPFLGRVGGMERSERGILLRQREEHSALLLEADCPVVLSVLCGQFPARIPSLRMKIEASKKPVRALSLAELGNRDGSRYGSRGSPTKIKRVYVPKQAPRGRLQRVDAEQAAEIILSELMEQRGDGFQEYGGTGPGGAAGHSGLPGAGRRTFDRFVR